MSVVVPRVRDRLRRVEIPLERYRQLQQPRALDEGLFRWLLDGLAWRLPLEVPKNWRASDQAWSRGVIEPAGWSPLMGCIGPTSWPRCAASSAAGMNVRYHVSRTRRGTVNAGYARRDEPQPARMGSFIRWLGSNPAHAEVCSERHHRVEPFGGRHLK